MNALVAGALEIAVHLNVENLVDLSRQQLGVAPHDAEQTRRAFTGRQQLGLTGQLAQRTTNQRQGRAQLVGSLGVEVQLLPSQFLAFLINTCTLSIVEIEHSCRQ